MAASLFILKSVFAFKPRRATIHRACGYMCVALALGLLVAPTLMLAYLHQPQIVALKYSADRPTVLSAPADL